MGVAGMVDPCFDIDIKRDRTINRLPIRTGAVVVAVKRLLLAAERSSPSEPVRSGRRCGGKRSADMATSELEELQERLRRLEDESAITRLIMSYGPAADACLASFAGALWLEDGVYDWDADGKPHEGSAAVAAMLEGDHHRGLVAQGVGHFAGPPLIDVDGDHATVLTYSLIMRRESDRFFLWRVERGPLGPRAGGRPMADTTSDQPATRRVRQRSQAVP